MILYTSSTYNPSRITMIPYGSSTCNPSQVTMIPYESSKYNLSHITMIPYKSSTYNPSWVTMISYGSSTYNPHRLLSNFSKRNILLCFIHGNLYQSSPQTHILFLERITFLLSYNLSYYLDHKYSII